MIHNLNINTIRTTPPRETSPGAERESDWPLSNLRFVTSTPTPSSAGTPAAGGRKSRLAAIRQLPNHYTHL